MFVMAETKLSEEAESRRIENSPAREVAGLATKVLQSHARPAGGTVSVPGVPVSPVTSQSFVKLIL